jgi:biotin operon repressor
MSGDECRPAGDAILRQLRDSSPNQDEVRKHKGYRLQQVDITLDEGRIVQRTKRVGEI